MLMIDRNGFVVNPKVKIERRPLLERGAMPLVMGIIVHQTDSNTAASSLAAYKTRPIGAHFLIDKDGTIYQTASVYQHVNHVGKLRARCLAEHSCTPQEGPGLAKMTATPRHHHELKKKVPARYPDNMDSIGIELVGKAQKQAGQVEAVYESVTPQENASLTWLVTGLTAALKIDRREIFRHPTVSQKTPSEASTARW